MNEILWAMKKAIIHHPQIKRVKIFLFINFQQAKVWWNPLRWNKTRVFVPSLSYLFQSLFSKAATETKFFMSTHWGLSAAIGNAQ